MSTVDRYKKLIELGLSYGLTIDDITALIENPFSPVEGGEAWRVHFNEGLKISYEEDFLNNEEEQQIQHLGEIRYFLRSKLRKLKQGVSKKLIYHVVPEKRPALEELESLYVTADPHDHQIDSAIRDWEELQSRRTVEVDLTDGAKKLLRQIVRNVQADPSGIWNTDQVSPADAMQEAITRIPEVLDSVAGTYSGGMTDGTVKVKLKISTWEILHASASVLDKLCFIPKRRNGR